MEEYKEKIHDEILAFLEKLDQEKKQTTDNQTNYSPTDKNRGPHQNQLHLKFLAADQYFTHIIENLQPLLNKGYTGIYISIQRPANNLMNLFNYYSIDTNHLQIIDFASDLTTFSNEPHPTSQETYIPKIISQIQSEIHQIKTTTQPANQFIMIDSINTMALYLNNEQIMQLITSIDKQLLSFNNTKLVIYGAEELSTHPILTDIENYFNFMTSPEETTPQKIQSSQPVST
jgi:hypothetical protein